MKPPRNALSRPAVSVLTVDDAADWLACVAARAPQCLAGWAIAMFAGLRRAKISRSFFSSTF